MWYLTSENDNRIIYITSPSHQIVIGRSVDNQVCNFAIPDDPSISRKHATLSLSDNCLVLQDLGSRYGTFVNSTQVEVNTNQKLTQNDFVKFGKMNSLWKVNYSNLTTCISTLKGENLQHLKFTLSKIGGILKAEWDDSCNYLTMPAITLTIKVVLALVQGSNIVTVEFWNKCLESVTNHEALPDPQEYLPEVVESTLNKEVVSFVPDSQRRTLFQDKKFIFFSKRQYEMYKPVLIQSGASPLLLSECRMTISKLAAPDVIVIQYTATGASQESQAQKKTINDIVNQLKNKGKRVVADAEIGLAILYCSLEKYCNPDFSFTSEVIKQKTAASKNTVVLAHESQDPTPQPIRNNVKIDESLMSQENNDQLSNKRKIDELSTEVETNPNKKFAPVSIKTENTKRRLSDEDSGNPKRMMVGNGGETSNETEPTKNDNNGSDDMFNFVKPITTNSEPEKKVKKLNLIKPQKRKFTDTVDDDNLFNFVNNKDDVEVDDDNTSKQSLFSLNKKKKEEINNTEEVVPQITRREDVSVNEIIAMRGSKLKELMEQTAKVPTLPTLKKEKSDDLENQMNNLNISNVIVTTCNNLVVKRENININTEDSLANMSSVKNFKKFKKVWPVKRQISLMHASQVFEDNTAA